MTDHVKDQLCQRIEELEKEKLELNEQLDIAQRERGALAAHLERLQRALKATMVSGWSVPVEEALVEAFSDSPQTSLARLKAQWQVEVLDKVLERIHGDVVTGGCDFACSLVVAQIAVELRQQSEGGET